MSILDFFRSKKQPNSASIAKERLQIIVAHERGRHSQPDYLPQLQKDLLDVIRKYIPIEQDQIQVELATQDNCSVLELNITLPESEGR
ncbi:cell division topological specificity factor MinE [Entomomonas sp. E2T0]|uniref:cell division topological specificity factor MinE n=1 Tax=Entomomonas sp. E2T0 TaxID=2930213 RepID=UPI002228499B|nr:cell division topological specificity factor MinE [Entomomonas sp. E2T0]UYZ83447.1 cell division topological specificity factor MinE [Entomomonas sp. E2T0]